MHFRQANNNPGRVNLTETEHNICSIIMQNIYLNNQQNNYLIE